MNTRRGPGCIEGRRLNLVPRSWLPKIGIFPRIHERIVFGHSLLQGSGRHRLLLILTHDLARQLWKAACAEKPAVRIHIGRRTDPAFALHRVCIEDGPNGPASFASSAVQLQTRIPPIESRGCFIYEPQARLVDVNHVLIVLHQKTYGPRQTGDRAILQVLVTSPAPLRIAVLISDHVWFFKNVRSRHRFHGLVGGAPKRCPNLHGGDLTVAALARIRFANHLVFFGEPGVKNPAEVHIARMTASPDDYTPSRPNVECPALIASCDTENPS